MCKLTTLKSHIDDSLATKTANSVLHKVFAEIKALAKASEHTEQWHQDSLNILRFSRDIEEGFAHSKATMLAVFKEAWDSLDYDFRKQYSLQFINFAKIWTGGKGASTIMAYIATAKIWILDEYGAGKRVDIVERAPDGKPIIENGKPAIKTVEFYPYTIDLSKLALLNPRALDNNMTDKLWEMLVDEFYTCEDIRKEHHKDKKDGNGHEYTLKYELSGPALVAYQNNSCVIIANELNWAEYDTDPVVKTAIDSILKILNVEMDEDKIFKMVREKYK